MEQAVQTGSVDNLNARKLLPGKAAVGMQLNGRPAQPGGKATSGTWPSPSAVRFAASTWRPASWASLVLLVLFLIKKPPALLPILNTGFSQGLPCCAAPVPAPPCLRHGARLQ